MLARIVAQRVSSTTKVCAHTIKDLPVAHVCRAAAGLPPPSPLDDRCTTAERWEAGRGWPRESKRQEHGGLSHGHWPCAPETVPSPSWMHVYRCNICGVQPIVADTSPLCKPPYGGRRHHAPPQPRGAMVRGQDGRGPHPVGMAPSLIREHLLYTRILRVYGDIKPHGRSDPLHPDTDPQRLICV